MGAVPPPWGPGCGGWPAPGGLAGIGWCVAWGKPWAPVGRLDVVVPFWGRPDDGVAEVVVAGLPLLAVVVGDVVG